MKKTPVRQLALRREDAEQIKYDAASSSSSSEDLSDSTSSFMTPSLEFPDRISFRNIGENECEINQIPDDLSEASPSGTVANNFELKRFKITLKQLYQSLSVATWMKKSVKKKGQIPDDDLNEAGTSLRISGGDGDMDRAYLYLGVSGPHDLAISDDTWKAHKMRPSSDIIDRVKSFEFDDHKVKYLDLSEAGPSGVVVDDDTEFSTQMDMELVSAGKVENKRCIEQTSTILVKSKENLVLNDDVAVGGGIKGVRPPLLKPPPSMKRLPIDLQGSSWDFLKHFAPKRSESDKRPSTSSSSDNRYDEEEAGEEEEVEMEEMGVRFLQFGDTSDEACSFTTNEGDSSSNTSPIYASGGSIITSWQKGQLLGRGSFGSVYEAISGDGEFFAFKEVSLLDQGSHAQECIQQLEGEIALLSQLQHQNIVRYRGMAKDGSNLYIFLELVTQGSLLKLYQRYKLSDSLVSLYTKQILDGLKYLHDSGFIHRDIKCANILVDGNRTVKLADFGLAKVSRLNDIKSCKGTPFWMAPEVINREGNDGYGTPADIWSLGCTVLEMLTSQIPYGNLLPVQAMFWIGTGTLPEIPETLSQDARNFILECLKVNPVERPTAAELLNHPFVRRPLPSLGSGSGSGSGLGSGSASPLPRR
ncbi:Mitogen-activated protein kinase kinase kinase 1 [Cardamine amara subsp. amara]|uniref:mitogen-activated protein kinase kinase kinase n=1 Tax=Cardamine amara subsp. amara TaxID=228776 RepID=A0ABD1ACD0_CARAN